MGGPVGGGVDHARARLQLGRRVGPIAALQLVLPGLEVVDPGLDRELVGARPPGLEAALPAVVDEGGHGRLAPARLLAADLAPAEDRGQEVVAVGKDVRLHEHGLAHRAPGGEAASIDLRPDVLDHDAPAAVFHSDQW